MKLTQIQGIGEDVTKALSQFGSSFELEDFTSDVIERKPVKPQLLSTLLVGLEQTRYMNSNTFKYDAFDHTSVLPSGKQFTGVGPRANKDKPRTYRWEIPSFGISGNVAPADYANRRLPGTENEVDTEAQHTIRLGDKMNGSWDLFNEQQLLTLITTDSNYVAGGPFTSHDFYGEVVGGSRTAANITFSDANVDQFEQIRAQKKLLKEEMIKSGEMVDEFVCICGGNFFGATLDLEKNESLGRPLKGAYDFASQEVTSGPIGTESFKVDNFKSENCGVTFIEYTIDIGGISIGADDAYLIPVRASQFILKAHAPAMTRQYANTEALSMYSWVSVDDRAGITRWEESNFLMAMVNPRLMRKMTVA